MAACPVVWIFCFAEIHQICFINQNPPLISDHVVLCLTVLCVYRPGFCAGTPLMERYKVSNEFPDDTLNFIKVHPLMDEAVASIGHRPWFLKTMVR